MSGKQPWLGMCHLLKKEGEQQESYQAIAATFCADREGYDKILRSFVEPKGYQLLWSEEVHPAGQWIACHPKDRNIGAGLARAVNQQHVIEIGTLKSVTQDGDEVEDSPSYICAHTIENIEPLDLQIGVDVPKSSPDEIKEVLFDEIISPDSDSSEDGEDTRPLKTYAILDAAKVQYLLSYLEACGLPFRCLFKGEKREELKDVAPYIVELSESSEFTKSLFTSSEMPSHLWDRDPGIYVRSKASLDELWGHYRKFTRIQDENKDWYYFAFCENHYANILINKAEREGKLNRLFGDERIRIERICIPVSEAKRLRVFTRRPEANTKDISYYLVDWETLEYARDIQRASNLSKSLPDKTKLLPCGYLPPTEVFNRAYHALRASREFSLTQNHIKQKWVSFGILSQPIFWEAEGFKEYTQRSNSEDRIYDFLLIAEKRQKQLQNSEVG